MIKLSIIIPYYKTYELTKKLLDSLIPQSNNEVEIILIDDGCNEKRFYSYLVKRSFHNFRLIYQENKGVSNARNKGIEKAVGNYVAFIDGDDMIMSNYIETLLNLIDTRNDDVICFNWLDINTNDVVRHPENPAVWKAIYKRKIVPYFNEELQIGEDVCFNKELEKIPHTRYYYDKVLYIYNSKRENSLTWRNERGQI